MTTRGYTGVREAGSRTMIDRLRELESQVSALQTAKYGDPMDPPSRRAVDTLRDDTLELVQRWVRAYEFTGLTVEDTTVFLAAQRTRILEAKIEVRTAVSEDSSNYFELDLVVLRLDPVHGDDTEGETFGSQLSTEGRALAVDEDISILEEADGLEILGGERLAILMAPTGVPGDMDGSILWIKVAPIVR